MNNKPFDIPDTMREMAERNVGQAREAYDRFLDATHKAQSAAEQSSGAVVDSAKDVQSLTLKFTEQNMAASFAFASALANAGDLQEALQIQQNFAQDQFKNYTSQTQALGVVMAKAGEKARP